MGITPLRALSRTCPHRSTSRSSSGRRPHRTSCTETSCKSLVDHHHGQFHEVIGTRHEVHLDARLLRRLVPDLADRDLYVCGPNGFSDGIVAAALQLGVPPERIHEEASRSRLPRRANPYVHSDETALMRRAPIVIGATIAGLAGVLTFHTKSAPAHTRLSARSLRDRGLVPFDRRSPPPARIKHHHVLHPSPSSSYQHFDDPSDDDRSDDDCPLDHAASATGATVNYTLRDPVGLGHGLGDKRSRRSASPPSTTAGTSAPSRSTSSRSRSSSSRPSRLRAPTSKESRVRATRAPDFRTRCSPHSESSASSAPIRASSTIDRRHRHHEEQVMGTVVTIDVYGADDR